MVTTGWALHELPDPHTGATYGECILTAHYNADGTLQGVWIDHADPKVLISPELLDEIERNTSGWPASLNEGVLRIQGLNQTVVYRITGRVLNGDNWRDPCVVGEWPD